MLELCVQLPCILVLWPGAQLTLGVVHGKNVTTQIGMNKSFLFRIHNNIPCRDLNPGPNQ